MSRTQISSTQPLVSKLNKAADCKLKNAIARAISKLDKVQEYLKTQSVDFDESLRLWEESHSLHVTPHKWEAEWEAPYGVCDYSEDRFLDDTAVTLHTQNK